MKEFSINIFGEKYTVKMGAKSEIGLRDNIGGVKLYEREILIDTNKGDDEGVYTDKGLKNKVESIIAHEIFHAYLNEAGIYIPEDLEELMATFYEKNWRRMYDSVFDILNEYLVKEGKNEV